MRGYPSGSLADQHACIFDICGFDLCWDGMLVAPLYLH